MAYWTLFMVLLAATHGIAAKNKDDAIRIAAEGMIVALIHASMMQGDGGSSIVSYNGKEILFTNKAYDKTDKIAKICTGDFSIEGDKVVCKGELSNAPFDICQPGQSIMRLKHKICLWEGPLTVDGVTWIAPFTGLTLPGGKIYPVIDECPPKGQLFTETSLKEICGENVLSDKYATVTYIPSSRNNKAVKLPSRNRYFRCDDPKAYICKFHLNIVGKIQTKYGGL